MYSPKRQFGNIGEDYVAKDLESRGYKILDRNYLKKWGEIDIVSYRGNKLHFIEVKTVKFIENSKFRPEENMHFNKIRRLQRTCQTFLIENREYTNSDWVIDLACVYVEGESLKKIEWIENIIL